MSKKTNYSKEDRIRLKKIIKALDKDIKRLKVRRKNYKEKLTLTSVSQQRELLKAYSDWHKKYRDSSYLDPYNVDNYLNSL